MKKTNEADRRKVVRALQEFWRRDKAMLSGIGLVFDPKRIERYTNGFGVFLDAEKPGLNSANLMLLLNEVTAYVQRKTGLFVVVMLDPLSESQDTPRRKKKVA